MVKLLAGKKSEIWRISLINEFGRLAAQGVAKHRPGKNILRVQIQYFLFREIKYPPIRR